MFLYGIVECDLSSEVLKDSAYSGIEMGIRQVVSTTSCIVVPAEKSRRNYT